MRCVAKTALLLALSPLAAALAQDGGAVPGGEARFSPQYPLGAGDEVRIAVVEAPQLDGTQRLAGDGTVTLAYVGKVPAAGLTPAELEASLRRILEADFVTRATVSVEVLEMRSRPITVLGAVTRPGTLAFDDRRTLLGALAEVGGVTAERGDSLTVLRRAENGLSDQIEIPLDELLGGAAPHLDLPLFPNDVINVAPARTVTVYLLGEIMTRGALEFRSTERVTVLTAIARAGGLTDHAAPQIRIRRETAGGTEEIEVNYRRLLAGREQDRPLVDGDVIVVKEAFF